jgi:hypothetical protein
MTDLTPEQERLLEQLAAFRPENFRRQRWILLDRARKSGLPWEPIAEALNTKEPGAIRMYRDQRPEN